MIKVGIVGAGNTIGIAQMHVEAYLRLPNVKIAGIYDIIRERACEYIDKYQLTDTKACASYEELLEQVDAVSICTPNATHIELVVQALKAGKHVLCEKPFGPNAKDCEKALQYAEYSGKVCMIGLCYRKIPGYIYLKQLIDQGALGEIFYIRQTLGGNRIGNPDVKLEWRMQESLSGPGAMADFGSHMLDIGDMLLRETAGPITEVQCMSQVMMKGRKRVHSDTVGMVDNDDVAMFSAKTKNGAMLSYTASRIGGRHLLDVFGSGGCAYFDGSDPFALRLQKKGIDGGYSGPLETIQVPEELYMVDENVPRKGFLINFYLQAKQFVETIEHGGVIEADFQRGIYVQKLIDALKESSDMGTVVDIDFE